MRLLTIPTDENAIDMFLHCSRCPAERPDGVSPRDWADLEIGATAEGLQISCKRHEGSVVHIVGFAADDHGAAQAGAVQSNPEAHKEAKILEVTGCTLCGERPTPEGSSDVPADGTKWKTIPRSDVTKSALTEYLAIVAKAAEAAINLDAKDPVEEAVRALAAGFGAAMVDHGKQLYDEGYGHGDFECKASLGLLGEDGVETAEYHRMYAEGRVRHLQRRAAMNKRIRQALSRLKAHELKAAATNYRAAGGKFTGDMRVVRHNGLLTLVPQVDRVRPR